MLRLLERNALLQKYSQSLTRPESGLSDHVFHASLKSIHHIGELEERKDVLVLYEEFAVRLVKLPRPQVMARSALR
jgi:hypothetical protein